MYINLEEKKTPTEPMTDIPIEPVIQKVEIIDETHNQVSLTLFIKPTRKMDELYKLFSTNNLSSITIYNDDKSMYGVLNGYDTIEMFTYHTYGDYYILSLSKKGVEGLRTQIEEQKIQLDKLVTEVSDIKNSVNTIVVSQTPTTIPEEMPKA